MFFLNLVRNYLLLALENFEFLVRTHDRMQPNAHKHWFDSRKVIPRTINLKFRIDHDFYRTKTITLKQYLIQILLIQSSLLFIKEGSL